MFHFCGQPCWCDHLMILGSPLALRGSSCLMSLLAAQGLRAKRSGGPTPRRTKINGNERGEAGSKTPDKNAEPQGCGILQPLHNGPQAEDRSQDARNGCRYFRPFRVYLCVYACALKSGLELDLYWSDAAKALLIQRPRSANHQPHSI